MPSLRQALHDLQEACRPRVRAKSIPINSSGSLRLRTLSPTDMREVVAGEVGLARVFLLVISLPPAWKLLCSFQTFFESGRDRLSRSRSLSLSLSLCY